MSELIDRAEGDDVIVPVRMRRSSFEKLASREDGRSVPVSRGMIGLVRDRLGERGEPVWTLVYWSGEPVWAGVPEQIPANEESARALRGPLPMRYVMPDEDEDLAY